MVAIVPREAQVLKNNATWLRRLLEFTIRLRGGVFFIANFDRLSTPV